ncbi:excinuclease ABC subunit C [Azorhizobium oxalatiphilum]|uniref:Excinuclease ABC subunit C n=1 Tax=Azorhizobium oxalatiphilum TaxID=980631 RepID=A0A917FE17_9HYPH|nr:GIY-YIG nuclease family protein [Azorhizobium oxalatiphilum]GGF72408.1 excinuclease ABC subunit C [Azorhizobium oxalatiphilum]
MRGAYVYILTNRPDGTLYLGVTNNLVRRIWEHRTGALDGFTRQHGLKRLVYFETHATMPLAIQREHTLKHWSRAWKVALVLEANPHWRDLYEEII